MNVLHGLGVSLLLACFAGPSGGARLEIERSREDTRTERIVIRAVYDEAPARQLTYRLAVTRDGESGTSETSQSGTIRGPGILATSSHSIGPTDDLQVRLQVYETGALLYEKRWSSTRIRR